MQAGASLVAVVIGTADQSQQTAVVQHIGNGVYAVSATVEKEGCYRISIQLEHSQASPGADTGLSAVAPLDCEVVCKSAAAAAQCCRAELQAEPWLAGRLAEVIVHQFDRRVLSSGVRSHDCSLVKINTSNSAQHHA